MRKKFSQVYILTGLAKILLAFALVTHGSHGWAALAADFNLENATSGEAIQLNSVRPMTSAGYVIDTTRLTANHVLANDTRTQAASVSGGGLLPASFLVPGLNAQFNDNASVVYGQVAVRIAQFASPFRTLGDPVVPEPSTIIAGVLLLLPLGGGALRSARKCKASFHNTNR